MFDSHLAENGRVEVGNAHAIDNGLVTEFVGFPVSQASFKPKFRCQLETIRLILKNIQEIRISAYWVRPSSCMARAWSGVSSVACWKVGPSGPSAFIR